MRRGGCPVTRARSSSVAPAIRAAARRDAPRQRTSGNLARDFEDPHLRHVLPASLIFAGCLRPLDGGDVQIGHIVYVSERPRMSTPDDAGQPPVRMIAEKTSHQIAFCCGAGSVDDAGIENDERCAGGERVDRVVTRDSFRPLIVVRVERPSKSSEGAERGTRRCRRSAGYRLRERLPARSRARRR